MSNYPNMSYCMNENTLLALRQIETAIREEFDGDMDAYAQSLRREELDAFDQLLRLARELTDAVVIAC